MRIPLCVYSPHVRSHICQPRQTEHRKCHHHQRRRPFGKIFFKDLYQNLGLNIFEYTFDEHDETVAYSLSIPFVSTFVFAAVMKHQDAPGTTFKRHMKIAKGVLSEDDYLLQEILFNPRTPAQVEGIRTELNELLDIINKKDAAGMRAYLSKIREKIK